MEKFRIILCSMLIAWAATSCGGDSASSGTPADSAKGGNNKAENKNLTPDVSPEMADFMNMLNGELKSTEEALKKYGSEGLDTKDMDLYGLKDPKVTAVQNHCYTLKASSGITLRVYVLCWEGGKIKRIENKGIITRDAI